MIGLDAVAFWDRLALDAAEALRWTPLTAVFVALSSSWLKGPVFVVVGALSDVRRRRPFPVASVWTALTVLLAGVVAGGIKELVDRARPAHAGGDVTPAVSTPSDPSFPSGHTMTAFAAAVVVGAFYPRLRWLFLGLAALVGVSRVYLGVHFLADVLAGAAAGVAIGLCAVWTARKTVRFVRRTLGVSLLRPVPVASRRSSRSTERSRMPAS